MGLRLRPTEVSKASRRPVLACVSPEALAVYIQELEQACVANPRSADLRTCLGVAHAVNYDVYQSMDALEEARRIDPDHFWAQLKYAELHYRLRVLTRAEEETRRAADLATTPLQLAIARQQMKEIRALLHTSIRNVQWSWTGTTGGAHTGRKLRHTHGGCAHQHHAQLIEYEFFSTGNDVSG